MEKKAFKKKIEDALNSEVKGANWDEKVSVVKQCVLELEQQLGFDESNKGQAWSDEELRLILKTAPTKENYMQLARTFRRSYGSIEQIFRWAATDQATIKQKRPNDSFIKQIKRISKEVGWRAT